MSTEKSGNNIWSAVWVYTYSTTNERAEAEEERNIWLFLFFIVF